MSQPSVSPREFRKRAISWSCERMEANGMEMTRRGCVADDRTCVSEKKGFVYGSESNGVATSTSWVVIVWALAGDVASSWIFICASVTESTSPFSVHTEVTW